jgi:tetrahydromethanopterin S-methyltransferase subunit G
MTESVDVKLARLEEKIDQVLRRLENGDRQFKELDERVSDIEKQVNRLWGGIALATVAIPLIIRYMMGG